MIKTVGPTALAGVLFTVCIFARQKNDFFLGPYVSNNSGVVDILKADLEHDFEATYDSGLMDYVAVETAFPMVEIRLDHPDDIDRALESRSNVWKTLLKGEKERWGSMKNLLTVYRQASNRTLVIHKGFDRIRDEWDGTKSEYEYGYPILKKM